MLKAIRLLFLVILLVSHAAAQAAKINASDRMLQQVLIVAFLILVGIPVLMVIVWFACSLSWTGLTSWPKMKDTHHFLMITGVAITVSSAIIAIGGMAELFPIDPTTVRFLWGAVVSGIILAVHKWFAKAFPSRRRRGVGAVDDA